MGAIEARFGSTKHGAQAERGERARQRQCNGGANGSACNGLKHGDVKDCCADGIMEAAAPLVESQPAAPRNFEEFIYKVWGAGIAKHFAIPYNRKLWAVPLTEMETSWLGGRVPLPDLEEMIEGALSPKGKPMGPMRASGIPCGAVSRR